MVQSVERTLLNARKHAKRGETEAARDLYQSVLSRFPSNKRAMQGLSALNQPAARGARPQANKAAGGRPSQVELGEFLARYEGGRLDDAVDRGRDLARRFPGSVPVQSILGAAYAGLGQLDDAVICYRQAVRLDPAQSASHNNLGVALAGQGHNDEAARCYRRAIELEPGDAEAHNNLGNVLQVLGARDEALASYDRALKIDPHHADALSNRGTVLSELGRFEDALDSADRAIAAAPDFAQARLVRGDALRELQRAGEALEAYRVAARLQPSDPKPLRMAGNALSEMGQTEEAIDSFRQALAVDPDNASAFYGLSRLVSFAPDGPETTRMQELLDGNDLSRSDRSHLGFAMGKTLADAGDPDGAFRMLADGNRLRKDISGYDIAQDRDLFARLEATFAGDFPRLDPVPQPDVTPVFILGMPRSGTTLAEQILASHSSVFGAGELPCLSRAVDALEWQAPDLTVSQLKKLRSGYFDCLRRRGGDAPFVTDKMPLNFRYVGFILAAIPEARIVNLQRDARATCWSIFKLSFGNFGNGFADDLGDLAAYYRMYRDLMAFWHRVFPGRILDLGYEALTEDQEGQSRALLDYAGLEWEPQVLKFHESRRRVRTASQLQVRRKLYQGSSQEWRKYEAHLSGLMADLDGV